jgi:hypothetical protein
MLALRTERGCCVLKFPEVTALWGFNGRFDGNSDVVVLQRRYSEGSMNNFWTEAASIIQERIVQEQ